MFTCELKGMDRAIRELREFSKTGVKFAMREAVTKMALETQRYWRTVSSNNVLTERNKFFDNMVQVQGARVSGNAPIFALVGLATKFGESLEEGGTTKHETGGNATPLPAAANMPRGAASRPRKVVPSKSLRTIGTLQAPTLGKSRKQSNAIALSKARKSGSKFAKIIRDDGRPEIVLVGKRKRGKLRGLFLLGHKTSRVKAHATLGPALMLLTQRKGEAIMEAALQRQFDRSWKV
jgi:hypothetical protein